MAVLLRLKYASYNYFLKNNNFNDTNISKISNNESISISINKNIITKESNSDFKINKNNFMNESSNNLITEKTINDNSENKKDSDNFSSLLNDTNGFNKMLNELKEEKKQEDKDFEKQKQKNEYNNMWLSIERKLDINTNDNNKSANKFINEIEEKEKKEKEKEKEKNDIEYDIKNTRIDKNFLNRHNKAKEKSFLDELKYESNIIKNNKTNNKDNNINHKNDIFNKPIDLGLNLNDYNSKNDLDELINKDNNEEFNFENAKRLKPLIKNNRRGSARKFLEENENKMKQQNIQNINLNKNPIENNDQSLIGGRRRIKA